MEIPDCMLVVVEENCYNRLGDCETLGFGCSRRAVSAAVSMLRTNETES